MAGLVSLVCCLGVSAATASAHGVCGRDWTVASACAISGPNVSVTGKLVAVNEADYYVFHAAANTQIRLTVIDRQPRSCIAKSACSSLDVNLYDRSGDEDYVEVSTANLANNVRSASSAPYILQTAGTYYLRVSAENAGVPYRVRMVTSPSVTIPGRSPARRASAAGPQPAHHSGGDTAIGGLIVLAVLGLMVRAIRRGLRRRRDGSAQDARAHADWRKIQPLLPQSDMPTERKRIAGRVAKHYEHVPKGVKSYTTFAHRSPRQDTFWPRKIDAPAEGAWVIFEGQMTRPDYEAHNGEPFLWIEQLVQTFPSDTERRARRHARWLERHGRDAAGETTGQSSQSDDGTGREGPPSGDHQHDPGPDSDSGHARFTRPDWAFEKLKLDLSASREDARVRYHELVHGLHPDRAENTTPQIRELAENELKKINAAYEAVVAWLQRRTAEA